MEVAVVEKRGVLRFRAVEGSSPPSGQKLDGSTPVHKGKCCCMTMNSKYFQFKIR